jgi:mono/diheme cytochrome c family protein
MIDHMSRNRAWIHFGAVVSCCTLSVAAEDGSGKQAARPDAMHQLTFEKDIKPILRAHCLDCHGGVEGKKGKLDMRLVRTMLTGGETGTAIEPGNAAESNLVIRIEDGEMPPKGAGLTPAELEKLKTWIAQGAKTARPEPEPEALGPTLGLTPEDRSYWAFQPNSNPVPPEVKATNCVRTPVDRFLLANLEPLGLGFRDDADKITLVRRVTLDLTGLPPTPEEVRLFLADNRPDAYERLVEKLLASPQYGERWARHWMDVAGYADSDGGSSADTDRPHAWRYRDWLIRSFNDDKPLDVFLTEQLAGDEFVPRPWSNLTPRQADLLTATGFLRMPADPTAADYSEIARNQVMTDTIKVVTTTTMGLSVACAQCHDHRYDPISHVDYYRLRALFEPGLHWEGFRQPGARVISLYRDRDRAAAAAIEAEVKPLAEKRNAYEADAMSRALVKELEKYQEPLKAQLKAAADTPADKRTPEMNALLDANPSVKISPGVLYQYLPDAAEELKKMDAAIGAVRAKKPPENFLAIYDEPPDRQPPATKRLHRGDYRQPLEEVKPGVPEVLRPEGAVPDLSAKKPEAGHSTGRRTAFAQWLFSEENPITARVLANRIWMHHFGRGLVATAGEFGRLGEPPTNPQLLDFLASELRSNGWRLKSFHRLIVLSSAYRQKATRDPGRISGDPDSDGRLLSRYPVHRLEAETIRDRTLAASGHLEPTMFGPPADVQADDSGQVVVAGDSGRRSVYVKQKRSQPVSLMAAFDAPVMETNCERRTSATVATQSLMLLNGSFVLDESKRLALAVLDQKFVPELTSPETLASAEVAKDKPADEPPGLPAMVATVWERTMSRPPEPKDLDRSVAFVREHVRTGAPPLPGLKGDTPRDRYATALAHLSQSLMASNEFLYTD